VGLTDSRSIKGQTSRVPMHTQDNVTSGEVYCS
jgi:hypothetical protein